MSSVNLQNSRGERIVIVLFNHIYEDSNPVSLESFITVTSSHLSGVVKSLLNFMANSNSKTLFPGEEHKKQRKLMNPVFTAAHVSKLSPLFYRIATEVFLLVIQFGFRYKLIA